MAKANNQKQNLTFKNITLTHNQTMHTYAAEGRFWRNKTGHILLPHQSWRLHDSIKGQPDLQALETPTLSQQLLFFEDLQIQRQIY
ncbi:hypothetical protein L2750_00650 [Shewanella submarina]|uniref:Uncharacterized protein n=1 Tax=Shewanella submarina TaxID=2016376 RepID=A0ABV7GHQ5_9GAMM|nr:hypothetical protein [Shewanella submarina]MCL1035668.1 hypothetical protein [Shewanella submarina]